jgi:hypothetical protein
MTDNQSGNQPGEQPDKETVNRESHPNASGPEGLAGDMGISSEREGPFEDIEGTGSLASTAGSTDGESPTDRGTHDPDDAADADDDLDDKPDETLRISNVDRTVGHVRPDPVANKHEFDPEKNPRH